MVSEYLFNHKNILSCINTVLLTVLSLLFSVFVGPYLRYLSLSYLISRRLHGS